VKEGSVLREKAEGRRENSKTSAFSLLPSPFALSRQAGFFSTLLTTRFQSVHDIDLSRTFTHLERT